METILLVTWVLFVITFSLKTMPSLLQKLERRKAHHALPKTNRMSRHHQNSKGDKRLAASSDPYACEVYGTRLFEQKMVDAGIMHVREMSVCDHEGCENCQPSRPVPPKRTDKGIHYCVYCSYIGKNFDGVYLCDFHYERKQKDKPRVEFQDTVDGCGHWTPDVGGTCDKCEKIEIHSGDGSVVKTYINYRPETENRMVEFEGTKYLRHTSIPDHATIKATRFDVPIGVYEVLWEWDTYKDGERWGTKYYKEKVTPEILASWQQMDVIELADEPWEPVLDPDTKEILGYYRHIGNGDFELKDAIEPVCNDEAAHQLTGDCGCWDEENLCSYCHQPWHKYDGTHKYQKPVPRKDSGIRLQIPKYHAEYIKRTTSTGPQ